MADMNHRVYLWTLAAIALVAGTILTATGLRTVSTCREKMVRRVAEYEALSRLDDRLRHMETAMSTWQERNPGPPAPLSILATNFLAGSNVEMRELASSNIAPELVARQVEVTCQDAPFDRAMQLVQSLDGLWPRWILVHLEIKSTDQAGRGRITMRFESIASPNAGPVIMQPLPEPKRDVTPPAPSDGTKAPQESPPTVTPPPSATPAPSAPVSTNAAPGGWIRKLRPEGHAVAPAP